MTKQATVYSADQVQDFAWPGGYPLYYFTSSGEVLCPDCARIEFKNHPDTGCLYMEANWEDPVLYCDECSQRIESAYAEDKE